MATDNDDALSKPSVVFDDRPTVAVSQTPHRGARVGRVGQRVGPFQLVERLSRVGTIGLYRATRPVGSRQPRDVAVRIVEDARDEHAAAWVRHEYDILSRLDHPAIPQAYGYYSSQVGVAMSVPPTITLEQIITARDAGRLELNDATALDIVYEVAEALRHAHGVTGPDGPISHNHLSTAHVTFRPDGSIVVLGFGAAPTKHPLGYTPPEQVVGAFTDIRSDQWRLGALLMELLLGTILYADLDDPEAAAAQGQARPWLDRLERRNPEAARVAARLLKPAAGSRYPSDNLLIRDLLELARRQEGQPDRRALVSQMRAVIDTEARRKAAEQRRLEAEREAAAEHARLAQEAERLRVLAAEEARRLREVEQQAAAAEAARLAAEEARLAAEAAKAAALARAAESARPPDSTAIAEHASAPPVSIASAEVHEDFDSIDAMDSSQPPSIGTILGGGDPTGLPGAVQAPARPRSLNLAPEVTEVEDPGMVAEQIAVAFEDEPVDDMSSEGVSLGLDRVDAPYQDGPSLGPISAVADDPAGNGTWEDSENGGEDPDEEITEVTGLGASAGFIGSRSLKWFPSELAAMAAIGVATVVAIVFMVWRFG